MFLKCWDLVIVFFVTFQQVSMGLSSGLYGGINSTAIRFLCSSIWSLMMFVLWNPALSRMKTYFLCGSSHSKRLSRNSENVKLFCELWNW